MDWTAIALGVLALAALPYVAGPILVGASLRFSTRPTMTPVDPAATLPPPAFEYLRRAGEALAALGFEPGAVVKLEGISPGTWSCAAMSRRADGEMAMAAAVFRSVKGLDSFAFGYVEFAADFADGSAVCTSNCPEPPLGPASSRLIVLRFPRVTDVGRLLTLHREAARRYGRGSRRAPGAGEWWREVVLDSLRRYAEHMCERGWFSARGEGQFGLTLKGALLGTWSNLPPWLQVRRRLARPMEREVGRMLGI